jgi:hypothetical protein
MLRAAFRGKFGVNIGRAVPRRKFGVNIGSAAPRRKFGVNIGSAALGRNLATKHCENTFLFSAPKQHYFETSQASSACPSDKSSIKISKL